MLSFQTGKNLIQSKCSYETIFETKNEQNIKKSSRFIEIICYLLIERVIFSTRKIGLHQSINLENY